MGLVQWNLFMVMSVKLNQQITAQIPTSTSCFAPRNGHQSPIMQSFGLFDIAAEGTDNCRLTDLQRILHHNELLIIIWRSVSQSQFNHDTFWFWSSNTANDLNGGCPLYFYGCTCRQEQRRKTCILFYLANWTVIMVTKVIDAVQRSMDRRPRG
jgi:hypothetical protein